MCTGRIMDDNDSADQEKYCELISALLLLADRTRSDINAAIEQLRRFTSCTKQSHMVATKIILRYVKGSRELEAAYLQYNGWTGGLQRR